MTGRRKIAVWGWGSHAKRRIVPAAFLCEGFELGAVITRGVAGPEYRNFEGRELRFRDLRDVLADPAIDTIYVTTPTGLHYEHCMAALDAGKHVLCEKSLTISLIHTRELVALAERKKLFLAEAFAYLHHPQFHELKRLAANNAVGRVLTITCEFGVPLDNPGFRRTPALGGGAFWDMACYQLSVLNEIFPRTPEMLAAHLDFPMGGATDEGGWALAKVEPSAHAFLSWGYGRAYRNRLMIHGDAGSLSVEKVFSKPDDYDAVIERTDRFGVRDDICVGPASSFVNMLNDLRSCIDNPACYQHYRDAAERQAISMNGLRAAAETQ